jgi:Amt family ammonium transporter
MHDIHVCMKTIKVVSSPFAVLIGFISGPIYFYLSKLMLKLRLDDVVQAVPLHLGCGIWGMVATGLFAEQDKYKNTGAFLFVLH